jgi:hypothetical protein
VAFWRSGETRRTLAESQRLIDRGLWMHLACDEAAFLIGANIAINGGQHMY